LALRAQLARLEGLVALSMVLIENDDDAGIIALAATALPELATARLEGVYLLDAGWQAVAGPSARAVTADLEAELAEMAVGGGALLAGAPWAWAYPLRSVAGHFGFIVVTADQEPLDEEQFALQVLAQQTGFALANAYLHRRERAIAAKLRTASDAFEHSTAAHDRLMQASVSGQGQQGIADVLHELTGFPVAIEDRHGNLRAWAGPDRPEPYPKDPPQRRAEAIERATRAGGAVRHGDRLVVVAHSRSESLSVVALVDPSSAAGAAEHTALEHGAAVLAVELARLQSLDEAELRLGRDLVEELLDGAVDGERALARAQVLGYDLARPHRVVIVCRRTRAESDDGLFDAVRRAARATDGGTLMAARHGTVVVLAHAERVWEGFRVAVVDELQGEPCRVGVGGTCQAVTEFGRSHREAELALRIQVAAQMSERAVVFDELGVFQLLAEAQEPATVARFTRHWLGALLDYDADHDAELVVTLSRYLESGGSYEATASALSVHRSTLRYRLQRIRDISGFDIGAPDERFNLQLATRAWHTLAALGDEPDQA
jgi:sugar diacid utilization regulator